MGAAIFISYRRDDSEDATARVERRLSDGFGPDQVFRDTRHLPPGADVQTEVRDAVLSCRVLLVIIGRAWLSTRLNDENDWVRMELTLATERGIMVIPVLLPGATMPPQAQLPESLRWLAGKNAHLLHRDPSFDRDVDAIGEMIGPMIGRPFRRSTPDPTPPVVSPRERPASWVGCHRRGLVFGALVAVAVVSGLAIAASMPVRARTLRQLPGLVAIRGAAFQMGSSANEMGAAFAQCQRRQEGGCDADIFRREGPARAVEVSSFYLEPSEVNNERFVSWLNEKAFSLIDGRYVRDRGVLLADLGPDGASGGIEYDREAQRYRTRPGYAALPTVLVTWHGASRFCQRHRKRLPTEAEWEWAARGVRRLFPWGDQEPEGCDRVTARLSSPACAPRTAPRAVHTTDGDVTPDRVHDLGGNVAEWTEDRFAGSYAPCARNWWRRVCLNPVATEGEICGSEPCRAVRGGAWNWPLSACRATSRSRLGAEQVADNIGFRCAASGDLNEGAE